MRRNAMAVQMHPAPERPRRGTQWTEPRLTLQYRISRWLRTTPRPRTDDDTLLVVALIGSGVTYLVWLLAVLAMLGML